MKSSTTFSKKNYIKNKEGRPHCWNRSKKEDHIVGTDPISNITSITVSTLCSLRYTPRSPHLTSGERRIRLIFDDFHFCHSRVIGLDMRENRMFTLCRMITWVVFLRMFWNFISSLLVKRGGSLSFLMNSDEGPPLFLFKSGRMAYEDFWDNMYVYYS
jgi:hypothetical protein